MGRFSVVLLIWGRKNWSNIPPSKTSSRNWGEPPNIFPPFHPPTSFSSLKRGEPYYLPTKKAPTNFSPTNEEKVYCIFLLIPILYKVLTQSSDSIHINNILTPTLVTFTSILILIWLQFWLQLIPNFNTLSSDSDFCSNTMKFMAFAPWVSRNSCTLLYFPYVFNCLCQTKPGGIRWFSDIWSDSVCLATSVKLL